MTDGGRNARRERTFEERKWVVEAAARAKITSMRLLAPFGLDASSISEITVQSARARRQ